MKNASSRFLRSGFSRRLFVASACLGLVAAAIVVIRASGSPEARIRLGLSREGVVSADDEPLIVDDDKVLEPIPVRGGRGVAILASLSTRTAARPELDTTAETIDRAKRAIADCRDAYKAVADYSCVFHKRERIDGQLIAPHIMAMKARTRPSGIYFKFVQPNRGREAIYEPAKNGGKILAHDVGLGKLFAGTMVLDPRGSMAMEENRHPIDEAGIGSLIQIVSDRWDAELDPAESLVTIHPHVKVSDRACTMIESTHTQHEPRFRFYRVKVFIDHAHRLPIRFEAFDWPRSPGLEPELAEEYTYSDLKTDIGLTDRDFDAANPRYSFGRF